MRILIVDNHTQFAESLARILEREGYEVDCLLEDLSAAEKMLIFQNTYDLIIFDQMYPDLSGSQIQRRVRSRKVKVPVLVLSKEKSSDEGQQDEGSSDLLLKPREPEDLLPHIEEMLQRPVEVMYEQNGAGITFNEATQQVFMGKKNVHLTHTEFAILQYLTTYGGTAVSREQLIQYLWGFDTDVSSNVIDTHIKNLRKKLDGGKMIETVRGQGYRIRE